jgi:hypothetical protein
LALPNREHNISRRGDIDYPLQTPPKAFGALHMLTSTLSRRASFGAALVASALGLQTAGAQSIAGKWEGSIFAQGNAIPVVITFDSTAAGWSGTLLVAQLNPNAISMAVTVKKDTVSMQLPEEGMNAFLQGLIGADKKTLNGMVAVQGDNSGSFQVTKAAAAAKPPLLPGAQR